MGIKSALKKVAKGVGKAAKFVAGGGVVGAAARKVSPAAGRAVALATNPAAAAIDYVKGPSNQPSPAQQAAAEEALKQQRKIEDEQRFDERQIAQEQRARAQREADLAAGRARGEELFGNEALGRVGAQRSADIAEILAQRKAQLGGFTPEEQQAMREQNLGAVMQGQQAGARDLARQQARSGVRGALGAAQQAAFQQATQQQLANQERDLFLANIAEKRGALDKLEGSTRATEQDELGRQQFNLGQQGKELAGKLTTEFGYGGLGAQDRAAVLQQILGEKGVAGSERIAAATKGKK